MRTTTTGTTHPHPGADDAEQLRRVRKLLAKRSFCTLATTSPKGRAHVAGVIYQAVDAHLYVHTMRSSRKATNLATNPHAAVCVPVRKLPVGPPFTIQFQARAELLAMDHPSVGTLVRAGRLDAISGHGALDEPDGCFLRITPIGLIHTYGIGVPLLGVIGDPLHAGARTVDWG